MQTTSPQETEAAGAEVARRLGPGHVVLVAGELGSGKTTFVRGACRALGVTEPVTSPTFTIGQLYHATAGAATDGALEIAHLDLYRLAALSGEDPALLADYVTAERIAFVEWPGLAESELAAQDLGARVSTRVSIEHAGGDARDARAIDISDELDPRRP